MATSNTINRNQARRPMGTKASKKENQKFKYKLFNLGVGLDLPLLIITLSLLGVGLIMLFSASFPSDLVLNGDSYYSIKRQAGFAVFGVGAMLVISVVDYHQIRRYNYVLYAFTVLLLILVFVPGISASRGDATRWINLGFTTFQPSELAKFAMIVMLAHVIAKAGDKITTFNGGVVPCAIAAGIILFLVALENHISALAILVSIAAIVMFVGGIEKKWFIAVFILAVVVGMFLIFVASSYASVRIAGWLDPFNPPEGVDTYQTSQSLYAIGAGQFLGVGLGQSTQKYSYLPDARNDFIFAIVCEELGFIGALIIILMFVALVWRGVVISMNARDKFGKLLGIGITFTIGLQAMLNICVVSNAIPNTGISLPFFSYGGTSLLMLLGEMGVLLSISRNSYVEKT